MVAALQTRTVQNGNMVPATPKFSVVIPCFNLGKLARDAVQSALDQSLPDTEVIVVDDGSTSPVSEELQSFLNRITLIRQTNGGLSHARNTGIRAARGAFIALLDGDDTLLPNHCAACLELFESDPKCLVAAPDAWLSGGGPADGSKLSDLYPRRHQITFENFLSGLSLVPGCCTFRKEAFDTLSGPYDETLSRAEDFLLNAQLLARGVKYKYLREPTYCYRRRAGSLSFDNPIPLAQAVLQALNTLEREHTVDSTGKRALAEARARYMSDLSFHLFRQAWAERSFDEAAGHARAVQIQFLAPMRRRWKFRIGRALVLILNQLARRG